MRTTFAFPFLMLFALVSLSAQTMFHAQPTLSLEQPEAVAAAAWSAATHDFGTVEKGTPVSYTFEFTNTSNTDLRIESVKPSCGCTVADYSKESIAPGETGYVTATYNAAKPGVFTKTITVNANTATPTVLKLRGEVI